MPPAKNHSEMQKAVCALCFRKSGRMINISARLHISIKEAILTEFGSDAWAWLPSVICSGCYKDLYDYKQNPKFTLKHVDFDTLVPPLGHGQDGFPLTRGQQLQASAPCQCSVCHVGRLSGPSYTSYKVAMSEPVGRPSVNPTKPEPESITVCKECQTPWGKGKTHVCNKQTKRKNKEELVRNSSEKTKQRIVSSQLKEIFEQAGASTRGGEVKLSTGGKPISVSLGKSNNKPSTYFSNESLNRLQLKMGATDNKMKVLANFLRINCSRSSVTKLDQHMIDRNKLFSDQFAVKNIVLTKNVAKEVDDDKENKKKAKKEKVEVSVPVVYAKDPEEVACLVMSARGLSPENCVTQVGVDDGQGLLKVML